MDVSQTRKLLNHLVRRGKIPPAGIVGKRLRVWDRADIQPILDTVRGYRDLVRDTHEPVRP